MIVGCACGREARPGQRTCRCCHAAYMRRWRSKAAACALLVCTSIDGAARARGGDIFARNAALERIRGVLDQALNADPLRLARFHVSLTVEKGRGGDLDP